MDYAQSNAFSKTRLQIAAEYNYSSTTFWRKLKEHKLDVPPGLINLKWQKRIYEAHGYPMGVSKKDFADVDIDD